jgi:tRNA(Leu) C34 or U34 (ribose-2'-O)-methylase TrmL
VDYGARGEFMLSPNVAVSSSLQYEQWRFPLLSSARESNLAASVQLTIYPHWRLSK